MADIQLPAFPASTGVLDTDLLWTRQGATDKKVTAAEAKVYFTDSLYSAIFDYAVDDYVKGSDGDVYRAALVNGPSSTPVDPVGDTSNTWNLADTSLGNSSQTWQDEAGNRLVGVTYSNTTGSAIAVSVGLSGFSAALDCSIFVGGTRIQRYSTNAGTSGVTYTLYAVVPAGSDYIITGVVNMSSNVWMELKA